MSTPVTSQSARALMNAAQNGHSAIVKLLLARGADVNAASQWKSTALHEACMNGHYDVVQILLNADAERKNDQQCRTYGPG